MARLALPGMRIAKNVFDASFLIDYGMIINADSMFVNPHFMLLAFFIDKSMSL